MKLIRILYITHYSELLGANRSLLGILSLLKDESSYQLSVLLPAKGPMTDALDELGISYIICKYYPSFYEKHGVLSVLKGIIKELLNILAIAKLYVLFKTSGIDIIHTNSSVSNIGAYLSRFLHARHVWHFREFVKQHYGASCTLGEHVQKRVWGTYSDQIIAISNALRDYYQKILPNNLISTIYNGVNLPFSIKLLPKNIECIDIALVGVIHPKKHQDIVLLALSEIVNIYHKERVHLHIWGNFIDDEYNLLLQRIVKKERLDCFVTFHGYQKDVLSQMSACHIGIIASEYEAFGRVTIEYMLTGLIPIASRSGANEEIVTDSNNGFLFNVNDSHDLARKLLLVIDNFSKLSSIVERARNDAKQYSVEATVGMLKEVYNRLIL